MPRSGKVRARKNSVRSHPMQIDNLGGSGSDEIPADIPKVESKYSSLYVRTLSGAAFVAGFIIIIRLGHLYCLGLLLSLQALITRELFDLARRKGNVHPSDETRELPGFRIQQWYIFAVACFYMYGRLLHDIILVEASNPHIETKLGKVAMSVLWVVLKRHTLITYCLYVLGFVMSVLSLKKGKYMYQFGQYSGTITIILFVLVQTSFFVSNIFDGLIWFVLPCALVIINDIMAYFAGKVFGRTPLIKLSPKKTLEGYVGGGTLTVLLSIPLSDAFSQYEWMTCSRTSFAKENLECLNTLAFEPAVYHLSDFIPSILRQCVGSFVDLSFFAFTDYSFVAKPIVVHGIFLALFASSIAPFGGFFASGVKRALKIKDFGDSIPGHGGLTDRMDCQCVMGVFAYVYVNNFVKNPVASMSYILDKVLMLDASSQRALFTRLGYILAGQDMLPPTVLSELNKL